MNKKIEVASFLGEMAKFQSILDKNLNKNIELYITIEKHYSYFEEKDFNFLGEKINEIVRDTKIIKRRITLLSDKVQKMDLLEELPTEIETIFADIMNTHKIYEEKWKEAYELMLKMLSKNK